MFFKKRNTKNTIGPQTEAKRRAYLIYTPVAGEVIPLREIRDGVFSEGILGKGCGIRPASGVVSAPVDGVVVQLADTKHALCFRSDTGVELMIHVGMDTVAMNGEGFLPLVVEGERVKRGQPVLKFSIEQIERAGHTAITAVVVTNSDRYDTVFLAGTGRKTAAQELLRVTER